MTRERARLSSFRRATYISSGDKSAKIPEIYARPGSTAAIIPLPAAERNERTAAPEKRRVAEGREPRVEVVVKGEPNEFDRPERLHGDWRFVEAEARPRQTSKTSCSRASISDNWTAFTFVRVRVKRPVLLVYVPPRKHRALINLLATFRQTHAPRE